ncbi:hypothetical protein [Haliscomenobacter sp.]|uniref:hypothetical protein n=1 Tax=Haliscomenobacter sp. TaxID=2717303 RepID=UPI003BA95E12
MEEGKLNLSVEGKNHFCIKNASTKDIIAAVNADFSEAFVFEPDFDWAFLYGEEESKEKRFLLLPSNENWTYLIWNVQDFKENSLMATSLSKKIDCEICYIFIDPWIATCGWTIADRGETTRSYYESHGQVLVDEGNSEIENTIRNQIKAVDGDNEWWEDKFWKLYKELTVPISQLNAYQSIEAIKGNLVGLL